MCRNTAMQLNEKQFIRALNRKAKAHTQDEVQNFMAVKSESELQKIKSDIDR